MPESRSARSRRVRSRVVGVGAALLGVLTLSSCSSGVGLPDPVTKEAEGMFDLWRLFFWIGFAVAVIMYIVIFWSAIRYRHRKKSDRQASQFKENTPVEILLVVLPLLIVVGLMFPTYFVGDDVEAVADDPDLTVNVTAFQWNWRFQYAGTEVDITGSPEEIPTLVLPVDETVRIVLESVDVDHSFYIPSFLFKRDAIPGFTNVFDFEVTKAGMFQAQCAEYCGLRHADMLFDVESMSRPEFDAWLVDQEREAAEAPPLEPTDPSDLEPDPNFPSPTPEVSS